MASTGKGRVRTADVVAPAGNSSGGNGNSDDDGAGFEALCLPAAVLAGVHACGYTRPSPVQRAAIPPALAGADCIVQAKSGTGKTCAFGVVALAATLADARGSALRAPGRCKAVVVEPTRELAAQTAAGIAALGARIPQLGVARFIGGLARAADVRTAQHGRADIVVGTPGRTADVLCTQRALDLAAVALLVVDEADRIAGDAPLRADVRRIARALRSPALQTLAFSATFTAPVVRALAATMRSPRLITPAHGGDGSTGGSNDCSTEAAAGDGGGGNVDSAAAIALLGVSHFVVEVSDFAEGRAEGSGAGATVDTPQTRAIAAFEAKARALAAVLDATEFNQCLVFCNSKQWACLLSEWLCERGWRSAFIGGGGAMTQRERLDVMAEARRFQVRILVSTDLVARGVDIERVNVVVNFDLPALQQQPQQAQQAQQQQQQQQHAAIHTYFHRAGRTGRFGTLGVVLSLCDRRCRSDAAFLAQLEAFLHRRVPRLDVAHGARVPRELYAYTMESRAEQEALSEFQTARALVVGTPHGTDAAHADARSLGTLLQAIRDEAARPPSPPPPKRRRKPKNVSQAPPPLPPPLQPSAFAVPCGAAASPSVAPPFFPQIPWSLLPQ